MAVVILHLYNNMKLVTNKFKSGGLHEKHVVAIIIIIIIIIIIMSKSEAPNTVRRRDIVATDRQTYRQLLLLQRMSSFDSQVHNLMSVTYS